MLREKEYWEQGKPLLEKFVKADKSIIEMQPEPRRSQLQRLMDGPVGEQFMVAPASGRRRYHNAFPHGLVDHSLRVAKNAYALAETLWPGRWKPEQLMFLGLVHDIGKAGVPGEPFYVPVQEQWKERRGEFWEIDQEVYAPNQEIGVWTLLKEGVDLSYEEMQAIRLNDGAAAQGNESYSFHESDLALIIHWADHAALRQEKNLDR